MTVLAEAPQGAQVQQEQPPISLAIGDPGLILAADIVDDLERIRIANANRLRILTTPPDVIDTDLIARGHGLTEDHPDVRRLKLIIETLAEQEHSAILGLQRSMRSNPLGAWVKTAKGVGEKQAARLLAAIGDPYWNTLHGRPRTVSELWAYCGLHTVVTDGVQTAARRRKGQKANWSSTAKMRSYLIAESCVKQKGSDFRTVYDKRRAHTAVTHPEWTAGHSHNDALRVLSKAVLREMWKAARQVHEDRS